MSEKSTKVNKSQFDFLKPCPFCGCNKAVTWHIGYRDLPWMVECMGCMAEGPWAKTEEEAIELWNMRVKE